MCGLVFSEILKGILLQICGILSCIIILSGITTHKFSLLSLPELQTPSPQVSLHALIRPTAWTLSLGGKVEQVEGLPHFPPPFLKDHKPTLPVVQYPKFIFPMFPPVVYLLVVEG